MSFNVVLQTNTSEKNRIGKSLTTLKTLTGTLRQGTSIIDPSIIIEETDTSVINACNYITISTFNRSYFVTDVTSEANNVWRLDCHVDVLESFKTQIKSLGAVIKRQENDYNLLLDDPLMKSYQNTMTLTKAFPNGLTNPSYVLAIVSADTSSAAETQDETPAEQ